MTSIAPISLARLARPSRPPDGGARPELTWIAIDSLYVDQTYQRELGERGLRNIGRIAERFDWAFFAPVIVAPLEGGAFFVIIDGQHRTTAAKLIGKKEVPCSVVSADRAKQAAAFKAINGGVTEIHILNLHRAAIAAGDADALAIEALATAAGVRIAPYPIPLANLAPDQSLAVGAIASALRHAGRAPTLCALKALAAPKARGLLTAPMIRGLAEWAKDAEGSLETKLSALAGIDLAAAQAAAKRAGALDGGARWKHVIAAIERRLDKARAA